MTLSGIENPTSNASPSGQSAAKGRVFSTFVKVYQPKNAHSEKIDRAQKDFIALEGLPHRRVHWSPRGDHKCGNNASDAKSDVNPAINPQRQRIIFAASKA